MSGTSYSVLCIANLLGLRVNFAVSIFIGTLARRNITTALLALNLLL